MTGFVTSRRGALTSLGLLGVGCAGDVQAQSRPSAARPTAARAPVAGVVPPLPMPCADRAGDLAGFILEAVSSADTSVVVQGQAFRAGDLPRGARLSARVSPGGQDIPVQLDPSVLHSDGSMRFAILSLSIPALPRGRRLGVVLSRTASPGPTPAMQDLSSAHAGRSAKVRVTPSNGGPPWEADLITLLGESPASERPWQSGPLAWQKRVTAQVPPAAVGGATSMRLVADISLRADRTMWVDLWLRNDVAMQPGGGIANYALRLEMDGQEVLRTADIRQFQYQAWGRRFGTLPGGVAAAEPPILRPNSVYLAATGAIANYDATLGVAERLLNDAHGIASAADWNRPLGTRGITQYMPTTGGRADIGPATLWQTAWITSGDTRAAIVSLGQAEASGSVPWHMWDTQGGDGRSGGWLTAQRWPRLWTDGRGGRPPTGLLQHVSDDTGWTPDTSHVPDLCYIPYLLTGRRAFLDQLQAQAAWCIMSCWPAATARGERLDLDRAEAVNVIRGNQLRGGAWALRQIDEAGWISPDGDPLREYFQRSAAGHWRWLLSQIPEWAALQGETQGWAPIDYGDGTGMAPWQQDFFASTVAAAARRGSRDARAVLEWMSRWLVGRFHAEQRGFRRHDGAAYVLAIRPQGGGAVFRTWSEVGRQTAARGWSNGDGWSKSEGYYGQTALMSLALIADVLGSAEARETFDWLSASGAPFTSAQDFARDPTFAIIPRDRPRGAALRCTG